MSDNINNNKVSFYKKLLQARKDLQNEDLKRDKKNPFFKSSYLSYDKLSKAIETVNLKNNILLIYSSQNEDNVNIKLIDTETGYSEDFIYCFSQFEGKGTNKAQDMGGTLTYAKRYAESMLYHVSVDEDEDANDLNQKNNIDKKLYQNQESFDKKCLYIKEGIEKTNQITKEKKKELLDSLSKIKKGDFKALHELSEKIKSFLSKKESPYNYLTFDYIKELKDKNIIKMSEYGEFYDLIKNHKNEEELVNIEKKLNIIINQYQEKDVERQSLFKKG